MAVGNIMGGDGEMVLAGSIPGRPTHPFAQAHRQSVIVLAGAVVMILFLIWSILAYVYPPSAIVVLLPTAIGAFIWSAFRNRRSFALPLVISLFTISTLLFLALAILSLSSGGDLSSVILGVLLLFMTWSSFKRIILLRHPMFRAWYNNQDMPLDGQSSLEEGEMIASCPHCFSALAIKPMLLAPGDNCPHCMRPLVLQETIDKLCEEE